MVMGMYDQLLSLTQQGLDRNNQIAMTSAQQPTMADVFMDRFRQGGQDRMAAQKMQSDMAMNEAYKNAQMQQMQTTADWHKRQRDLELAKYISENKTGENGPEVEAFVQSQGGSADLVPKMRFQESPYQVESGPAFPGGSLSEGGEDTETTKMGQMPVEWSDWGAGAAFKQKGLDMKQRLAEMSMQTKSYLASLKASDAKSAVGKIMQDLQNKIIRPELAHDAILKATVFFDPANAALIGQGLNPTGSGLPIRQFQQTPGAATLPQPQVQPAQLQMPLQSMPQPQQPMPAAAQPQVAPPAAKRPMPAVPGKPVKPVAGPKPFPGGKADVAANEELSAYQAADSKLVAMDNHINKITSNPAYGKALSAAGIIWGRTPKTPEYGVFQDIKVLKNEIMLEAMNALKLASKTGATGMGALSEKEGDTLRNSIAAIDENMSKEDFDKALSTVRSEIARLRGMAKTRIDNMSSARNVDAPPQKNYEGEVSPTGAYEFKGGKWVERKR
jgi:hypothetical protein